ncbi:MAG: hypothetical protein HY791_14895 [Deltaproteobacteria bacterium]|nr:hypothetical protein [Deltaproteobacteria bacterium]
MTDEADDASGAPPEDEAPPTASGVRAYANPRPTHSGVRAYAGEAVAAKDLGDTAWDAPAEPAEPDRAVHASEIVFQESRPPVDHTTRIRAERGEQPAPAVEPAPAVARQGDSSPQPDGPTSSDLARRAQKARRRARDQKAERTALLVVLGIALAFGAAGWFVLGMLEEKDQQELASRPDATPQKEPTRVSKPVVVTTKSSDDDEEIPALTTLREEGLTIAAEGLPRIIVEAGASQAANIAAAVLTCRFAYGIWEFSPNSMFKFVPTCAKLRGEEIVGAYEVRGNEVWLSPISTSEGTVIETVFRVAKPSSVQSTAKLGAIRLRVEQRITAFRPGMNAIQFQRAFAEKNTIDLGALIKDGASAPAPATPREKPEEREQPKERDPVLDLLDENDE